MSPMFIYLRHFTFILQHLVLIIINTFSHILICMFDEITKKLIIILHKPKNLSLPQKNKKFKPRRKAIPLWGYSINTMDWIILVHAIRGVLLMPKITQCTCNTPIREYYNSFGSITYLKNPKGVLHSHTKT
jgi:hypothetical protein